jgi:hypothetical protein
LVSAPNLADTKAVYPEKLAHLALECASFSGYTAFVSARFGADTKELMRMTIKVVTEFIFFLNNSK